jgi:transglutaminase/protease-like cytokinesis protein 3
MAEIAGLTADIVSGKIKTSDGKIAEDKHAWIFVYTHAYEGLLIDPTWGAGAICDGKFIKSNDKSMWFNVSPYWMAFSHFPDQDYWTKLDINITEGQFESLPYLVPSNDSDGKDVLFESLSKL